MSIEAWVKVMGEVQAVRKGDRNQQQGFNFRGIDAVMNAAGPAMRKHGVAVVPTGVELSREHGTTKRGAATMTVIATVEYAAYGPDGLMFTGAAVGEAMDMGDKATAKAMSVAYRTFLLQSLTIPTDEPDPDSQSWERGANADAVRQQCNNIVVEFAQARGLDAKELAGQYRAAGGTADPVALTTFLNTNYPA